VMLSASIGPLNPMVMTRRGVLAAGVSGLVVSAAGRSGSTFPG
jgi:hypothetical protein